MDLDKFLALEREKLHRDKDEIEQAKHTEVISRAITKHASGKEDNIELRGNVSNLEVSRSSVLSIANAEKEKAEKSELEGSDQIQNEKSNVDASKSTKEWVNYKELVANLVNKENQSKISSAYKDDMEQWVTDTFYSYFPGFNNEYQKRQNYLRDRQRENQENFLKHQMLNPSKNMKKQLNVNPIGTESILNSKHLTDKTELEIIVNNPNYVPPPKNSNNVRPGSTRHKLLQELKHTDFAITSEPNEVKEWNRHNQELESARKKNYQRELMQQIEEKRRSIELIREKERMEDEALTKRLHDQLKTIQLEEQLEKEKMRADKLRFDAEQNRVIRDHLIDKLENDTKLLYSTASKEKRDTNEVDQMAGAIGNKVYKYFSNSAKHEYRRGKPLPVEMELDLDIANNIGNSEKECFHLSDKVCPMCDAPLKSYEACCLRCQRRLSLKLNPKYSKNKDQTLVSGSNVNLPSVRDAERVLESMHSYSLVCVKCERLYAMCPTCLAKSEVCRACNRQINVCLSCRRQLCTFCLEEIACGKDVEQSHINEKDVQKSWDSNKDVDMASEGSFRVLEINHEKQCMDSEDVNSPPVSQSTSNVSYKHIHNNLHKKVRPPYSIYNDEDSKLLTNFKAEKVITSGSPFDCVPKFIDKNLNLDLDSSQTEQEQQISIERIRKETDKRLSRYMRNYGDLVSHKRCQSESHNRSTQTSPETAGRRDIVLNEEHNLSMPLLREMPKMVRNNINSIINDVKQSKIEHLKRRWEVPAVQKFSITSSSPRVLTQIGAIRKQLQEEDYEEQ